MRGDPDGWMVTTYELIRQRCPAAAVGAEGGGPCAGTSPIGRAVATRKGHSLQAEQKGNEGSCVTDRPNGCAAEAV